MSTYIELVTAHRILAGKMLAYAKKYPSTRKAIFYHVWHLQKQLGALSEDAEAS